MLSAKPLLGAALAVAALALPSQAGTIVNFTDADLGHDSFFNTTGATSVDVGTVVVTRDPAGVTNGGLIDAVIYTVSDPSIGGDVEVTVSISSTTASNTVTFLTSRSEIRDLFAGDDVTLSAAITSVPAGFTGTFLGFSQIDFESLSGGEDTTLTSGGVTTPVLDSSASGDRFMLADEFAGLGAPDPITSFTITHVGSTGNTGNWDLRDWDFSIEVSATVPEPSSLAILGLGGLACLVQRRKR